MQEELEQFPKKYVRKLVELPEKKISVRAKCVFKNKLNTASKVMRNNTRLVIK